MTYNKLLQEENSNISEIEKLKVHSDQMLRNQQKLSSELDALDKHMVNLNNQNQSCQRELEEFVETDEQIRMNLDRRSKVEQIRQKVDDVIRRSQEEVTQRIRQQQSSIINPLNDSLLIRTSLTKSANHFSPKRNEVI